MDSTLLIGLAGVGGTLLAGLGAPWVSATQARSLWLRQQHVVLYSDAVRHVQDLRLRYFTDAEAGMPPGGRTALAAQDDVTARMELLADAKMRRAWAGLVDAERAFDHWVSFEYSGDPDERAPDEVLIPLKESLDRVVVESRRATRRVR
jgi:hypothetical protein